MKLDHRALFERLSASSLPTLFVIGASSLAVPLLAASPADPAFAAGVFPPWWDAGRAIAAASEAGDVLRVGAVPFIVIIRAGGGDAAGRLARQGAWFSIDPRNAIFCGTR